MGQVGQVSRVGRVDRWACLAELDESGPSDRGFTFEDMGGRLSFSAALVDDHGSGLVLSAISGRTEARAYAKIVDEGESEIGLSPEERKAIAEAMTDRTRQKSKVKARR